MAESGMPARIWATCNGMSTRLPDGHRQFIGGWSEDKDRPRAEQFIRADLVEPLVEALRESQRIIERDFPNGQLAIDIRAALSSWEAASHTPLRARQAADTEGAK